MATPTNTAPKLPSRYEDLDEAFRGQLRPNQDLIQLIKQAYQSIKVTGGCRFIPIFGRSGSGKSCAALELSTHLPQSQVFRLGKSHVEDHDELVSYLKKQLDLFSSSELFICVIDQYEEVVKGAERLPSEFVERLSSIDRSELAGQPIIFLWLTTNKDFQGTLEKATSRNERLLATHDFSLEGPRKSDWPEIIEETFTFHNAGSPLADFDVLREDIENIARNKETLGSAIEATGRQLANSLPELQDLSEYQVIMLWPVTDGLRITRVGQFADIRAGYRLDWNSWYKELNAEDREQLPLHAFNRARLYFDIRVVPLAAADLQAVCGKLDTPDDPPGNSYLDRFRNTHFYLLATDNWDPDSYAVLRERASERAEKAKVWYEQITDKPTIIGQRLAACFKALGHESYYEETITTPHSKVRADCLIVRPSSTQSKAIVELKLFSTDNTRPSSIKDAIRTTLKRHAQLAGFLDRQ